MMISAKPACDAAHRKGDFAEATCVVFHYYDNGQLMLAMFFAGFIDCFLEQVFQKTWVFVYEGWHQPNSMYT